MLPRPLCVLACLSFAVASLPSLSGELAKCHVTNSSYGSCAPYPSTGVCAQFFPMSALFYLPQGVYYEDVEAAVIADIQAANAQSVVIGPVCLPVANAVTCLTHFYPCVNGSSPGEALPILPCIDLCADYWTNCYDVQKLVFQQEIHGDYKINPSVNCLWPNTTFDSAYGAIPQPADTWGGRPISGYFPTINGLLGEVLMPVQFYNYTYTNGSVTQLQCYKPNNTLVHDANNLIAPPKVSCPLPLLLSGGNCQLPCPFPVITSDVAYSIQAAYVASGLFGFLLCFFVFCDSTIIIYQVYGKHFLHFMLVSESRSSSKPENSTSSASPGHKSKLSENLPARKQTVRASTLYAMLGALLGCIYFFIGPLATITNGSQVSCLSPTMDVVAIVNGAGLGDPLACKAQRIAPFVLQAIFNLVLYSIINVLLVVNSNTLLSPTKLRTLNNVGKLYCTGVPLLCMIVALVLDDLSTNFATAAIQVSRQAVVCQMRLSQVAEWLLIFAPFIVTGCLICALNVEVIFKMKQITGKAAVIKTQNSHSDKAINMLMKRLAVLGLLTFFTVVIVIVCTVLYTTKLSAFSPAYATYLYCLLLHVQCIDCNVWLDLALPPSNASLGIQLFAESFIVVLFGVFFAAASLARIWNEREKKHAPVAAELNSDASDNRIRTEQLGQRSSNIVIGKE